MAEKIGGLLIDLSTNVARLQQDMNQASSAVKRAANQMSSSLSFVKGLVGGLFAGLSAGVFAAFIKGTANAADELGKLSQKVGITVESLSGLQYGAKLADVSTEQLKVGLQQLNKSIDENNPAFKRLGISLTDANGKAKTTEQVLGDVADRFAGMKDEAGKTKIAMDLFGRSGADLIPLLNAGSDGLRQFADEARKAGVLITTEVAQAAEQFNDNLTKLQGQLQGLGMIIAGPLIKNMALMTEQFLAARDATGSWSESILIAFNRRSVSEKIVDLTAKLDNLKNRLKEVTESGSNRPIRGIGIPTEAIKKEIAAVRKELETLQAIRQKINDTEKAADSARNKPRSSAPKAEDKEGIRKRLAAEKELQREIEQFNKEVQAAEDDANRRAIENKMRLMDDELEAEKDKAAEELRLAREIADFNKEVDAAQKEAMDAAQKQADDLAKDSKKASKEMLDAIEGFGRGSARAFAEVLIDGKDAAGGLTEVFKKFFTEMIEQQLYKNVFQPIFGAAGDAFGGVLSGIFGGGKAAGGPVSAMTPYLVGENGPELFMPGASGNIVPNHALGGGVTIVQNINVAGGVNAQEVYAAMKSAKDSAKSEIMRSIQRNGSFSKATRS